MSALRLPTLLCRTTESLLVTVKMLWQRVSKLLAKLLVLSFLPTSQATQRLRPSLPLLSLCPQARMHTECTGSRGLRYFQEYFAHYLVLCLTGASVTLPHFLISFPTVVFFSLFHNWTFVSPSISKKHLIWFLSHGQQPRRLKKPVSNLPCQHFCSKIHFPPTGTPKLCWTLS